MSHLSSEKKGATHARGTRHFIVLVCGGRDYADKFLVNTTLDCLRVKHGPLRIVHGGATGADTLAHRWAFSVFDSQTACYHADWKKHGRAAGPIRNQQMLKLEQPDLVLAFSGGRGTAHMVSIARAAGVPVKEMP